MDYYDASQRWGDGDLIKACKLVRDFGGWLFLRLAVHAKTVAAWPWRVSRQ